jgi:hypothetical protein
MRTRLVLPLLACAVLLSNRPAAAQSANDDAAGRVLFDEGRKLMDQGKFAEACPKFEDGMRVSPGVGMKFNLAECYERQGKLASAWAAFLDAAGMAKNLGQGEREKVARRRAVALEPELLRVRIDVATQNRVQGLEVKRDGIPVGQGQMGLALPVDSGPHVLTATAPGRKPFDKPFKVEGEAGKVIAIEVPLLEIDPASKEKATTAAAAPPPARTSPLRTAGWITSAAGVAGIGIGSVFGIIAMNKYGESSAYCYPNNQCLPNGITLRHDAISAGNVSTVGFIAGGSLLAIGLVLVAISPSSDAAARTGYLGPLAPNGMQF